MQVRTDNKEDSYAGKVDATTNKESFGEEKSEGHGKIPCVTCWFCSNRSVQGDVPGSATGPCALGSPWPCSAKELLKLTIPKSVLGPAEDPAITEQQFSRSPAATTCWGWGDPSRMALQSPWYASPDSQSYADFAACPTAPGTLI